MTRYILYVNILYFLLTKFLFFFASELPNGTRQTCKLIAIKPNFRYSTTPSLQTECPDQCAVQAVVILAFLFYFLQTSSHAVVSVIASVLFSPHPTPPHPPLSFYLERFSLVHELIPVPTSTPLPRARVLMKILDRLWCEGFLFNDTAVNRVMHWFCHLRVYILLVGTDLKRIAHSVWTNMHMK